MQKKETFFKLFSYAVRAISSRIGFYFKVYMLRESFYVELKRWYDDGGDKILRYNHLNIDENSIVFDVGGYKGDFAYNINMKYGCKVYLFEPHPEFYAECERRFSNNDKVIPLNFGLADLDGEFTLSDCVDGSSFVNPLHYSESSIKCDVREFFSVLRELNVQKIDLMKINIEGGEYPLLIHISDADKLDIVDSYQIQFHNFIDNAEVMRNQIAKNLGRTHSREWCYEFIWESWSRVR